MPKLWLTVNNLPLKCTVEKSCWRKVKPENPVREEVEVATEVVFEVEDEAEAVLAADTNKITVLAADTKVVIIRVDLAANKVATEVEPHKVVSAEITANLNSNLVVNNNLEVSKVDSVANTKKFKYK